MSLVYANRHAAGTTLVLFLCGGSNARGNNAATGNPAAAGYTMPAGCTLYEESATPLTAYPADHHGPEVGIFSELRARGFTDPIVVVKSGQEGSSLANWVSNFGPTLVGLYPTTGRPTAGLFVHGANDATGAGSATYGANLLAFTALLRRDRGAGVGGAIVRLKTMDLVSYPNTAIVQAAQAIFVTGGQGQTLIDADDLEMRVSDSHYVGASLVTIGRRFVADLFAGLVITT